MKKLSRLYRIIITFVIFTGSVMPGTTNQLFAPQAYIIERVSVATDGTQGDNDSYGSVSSSVDGRFIAFESLASNLVVQDTNDDSDVFVHDSLSGETIRVSVSSDGAQGNSGSLNSSISADGRYVAFESYATNFVTEDNEVYADVFVRDLMNEVTILVSVDSLGTQGNFYSGEPSISANGRYVAFHSSSTNLVEGDTLDEMLDIFVHDLIDGDTIKITQAYDGTQVDNHCMHPSISGDGRYVAFISKATNLVIDDLENADEDIFVYDLVSHVMTKVTRKYYDDEANNPGYSWIPSISSDGRYVVYPSNDEDLMFPDSNEMPQILLYDQVSKENSIVSISNEGDLGNGESMHPTISGDGRYVTFDSFATNLVEGVTEGGQIYVHDNETGETTLVSQNSSGAPGDRASFGPFISAYGNFVSFISASTNLVDGDTNEFYDVFVHSRLEFVPGNIDLDVAKTTVSLADGEYHTKQSQPYVSVLEASVTNHGPDAASQVSVQFYDGPPATGTLIASTTLHAVLSGTTVQAHASWTTLSSPATADIYVRVSSPDVDSNQANNVTSQGTPAYIAFADFQYDPDTFWFPNWNMTDQDFIEELFIHLIPFSPLITHDTWRYCTGPAIYYLIASGGHCAGMSQASIIYWDTPLEKPVQIDTYLMEKDQVELDLRDQTVRPILFFPERSRLVTNPESVSEKFSPTNAYLEIKNRLNADPPRPAILEGFFSFGSHAVVAYKVVEVGVNKHIFYYDSEYPMDKDLMPDTLHYLTLDESNDTLDYPWGPFIHAMTYDPIPDLFEITMDMLEDISDTINDWLAMDNKLQGYFNGGGGVLKALDTTPQFVIRDSQGNRLGYDQGVFYNEIPGAEWSEFDTAYYWLLPADGSYTLETEGAGTLDAALSFAIPLSDTMIQETVFSGFELPLGATATTSFSQATTIWEIEIADYEIVTPTVDQQTFIGERIMLPIVVR